MSKLEDFSNDERRFAINYLSWFSMSGVQQILGFKVYLKWLLGEQEQAPH